MESDKAFCQKSHVVKKSFAMKLLAWKPSGFSVDNSVSIPALSQKTRVNLSQYIVRHPVSLQKVLYIRSKGTVIYKTKYNEYWKENIRLFKVTERSEATDRREEVPLGECFGTLDFIAELTMHIPPKHKHLILYYGLYSSRTKGKAARDGSLAKYGYTSTPQKTPGQDSNLEMENVSNKASRLSWARLIQKVYEVDPLICPV